ELRPVRAIANDHCRNVVAPGTTACNGLQQRRQALQSPQRSNEPHDKLSVESILAHPFIVAWLRNETRAVHPVTDDRHLAPFDASLDELVAYTLRDRNHGVRASHG